MVLSHLMAALSPWTREQNGHLLVLSATSSDDALIGNFTTYGGSAGDLNPIGGLNNVDLKTFCSFYSKYSGKAVFDEMAKFNIPKADDTRDTSLAIITRSSSDLTPEELRDFGNLRMLERMGPVAMFEELIVKWADKKDVTLGLKMLPSEIAQKVKHFFRQYGENRHKVGSLTPFYHAEGYSNCDNRYDHRQVLYDTSWKYQFAEIDHLLNSMES